MISRPQGWPERPLVPDAMECGRAARRPRPLAASDLVAGERSSSSLMKRRRERGGSVTGGLATCVRAGGALNELFLARTSKGGTPPGPPLTRGGGARGRAIADRAARTTSAPAGGRSQTARRELPRRRRAGDSRLRGENYLGAGGRAIADRRRASGPLTRSRAGEFPDGIGRRSPRNWTNDPNSWGTCSRYKSKNVLTFGRKRGLIGDLTRRNRRQNRAAGGKA